MPMEGLSYRSRKLPAPNNGGPRHERLTRNETVTFDSDQPLQSYPSGTQSTGSRGNPFNSRKRISGDLGGPFETTKSYLEPPRRRGVQGTPEYSGGYWYNGTYNGPVLPAHPQYIIDNYGWPPSCESSDDELALAGTRAVDLVKPTNSMADLTVALGEIFREGLPSLVGVSTWRDRTSRARGASGDYLNVQFGWRPLLGEITDVVSSAKNAKTALEQFARNSGRPVRRRHSLPSEEDTVDEYVGPLGYPFGPINATSSPDLPSTRLHRSRKTTVHRWFSGSFTYHLPSDYDSRGAGGKLTTDADKLLGLSLDPETVWNLAPWTWAVDWFSSVGSVLSFASDHAKYGLVMQYGYVMEESTTIDTYTRGRGAFSGTAYTPDSLTFVTKTKKRLRANPYGFGVSWDDLSPFQLSIAAALGLSKSR